MFFSFGQCGFSPGICRLFDDFCLGRVGVNGAGDGVESQASLHGQSEFTNDIARMGGYDGGSDYCIGPFFYMYSGKALVFSIKNSPIDLIERKGEGVDRDVPILCILFI